MSGSIQILRQELPLTEEQAQLMDIVLRESERLNDTIRSFLAYAKPQRFSIARLDVRRVLNDAAVLLRNSSEVLDGHVIDVRVPPDEVAFEADENQIRQIVWNLATNGLRAMRDGGRLTLGARVEPGGRAVARLGGARGVGRGGRDSRGRARRDLPAVSRHVLEGHRSGARHRAPHRQRLRRRDSTSARRRARDDDQCQAAGQGCRRDRITKNEQRKTNRANVPLNRELANGEPGTVNSEPGTRNPEPGTPGEAPRRGRRAIDARAAVDRPAARRLRRDAGRKRPRGDRRTSKRGGSICWSPTSRCPT